ncbi:hypothetical protein [Mesorhizobium sp. B2-7-1]|uniref:hypothetical protein n=1 Tax=Mesorhizobium sp. B2-7-1 TaxID=2589909 RepID=UPI00112CF70B|nr:hypothetical protein [Mesorhizobium sp. B2-7-1]TPJ70623.1 hypothetical protein FJ471_09210 [Mesorhizobium sp. B2-7-1]
MISAPNPYDFADIKSVARQPLQSDPALSVEDIVRSLHEDLHEGETCPPALIEAVKKVLSDTPRGDG